MYSSRSRRVVRQGGFIWDWVDQGLRKELPHGASALALQQPASRENLGALMTLSR